MPCPPKEDQELPAKAQKAQNEGEMGEVARVQLAARRENSAIEKAGCTNEARVARNHET